MHFELNWMPAGLILFAGAAGQRGVVHSLIPRLLCGSLGMGLGAIYTPLTSLNQQLVSTLACVALFPGSSVLGCKRGRHEGRERLV